jgi:hypothetical protein
MLATGHVSRRLVLRSVAAAVLILGIGCAAGPVPGRPPLSSAVPQVQQGEWYVSFRTTHSVAAATRGPLQCEVDAFWATHRQEVEAAGVTRATFSSTHYEARVLWIGWRPEYLGDVTVFLELERDRAGQWRKTSGWTVPECAT